MSVSFPPARVEPSSVMVERGMATTPAQVVVVTPKPTQNPYSWAPHPRPKFDPSLLEERLTEKVIITEFGKKGVGKTYDAYSLPGRKLVFSFDGKSKGIKDGSYNSDPNIRVVDAVQLYADYGQPEDITFSGMVTIDYLTWALDVLVPIHKPHWIVFDGLSILINIAEMKMRYLHGVTPTEGFKETSWWKDRSIIIKALHRKAAVMALMGVFYTADYAYNVAEEGSLEIRQTARDAPDRVPKWIDIIDKETDITIEKRTFYSSATKERIYEVYVQNSKDHLSDILETGKVFRVPSRGFIPWGPGMARRYKEAEERYGPYTPPTPPVSKTAFEAKYDYESSGAPFTLPEPATTPSPSPTASGTSTPSKPVPGAEEF